MRENSLKTALVFIVLAYLFSVGLRYIYIGYVDNQDAFYWHHQLMINNVDGYYYMQGARDILEGTKSYLSPIGHPLSYLTAFIAKWTGLSIDTVALYMPGFFGSLVVVPLVMIGRLIGHAFIGFLAALLAGIAWSYYHRTMFGYYDTDLLVVVLPTFAVWFVMEALKGRVLYAIGAVVIEAFMIFWHGGLYNVAMGIFVMGALYALWQRFIKKDPINEGVLLYLLVPLLHLPFWLAIGVAIALFLLLRRYPNLSEYRLFLPILASLFILIVALPWMGNVFHSSYFTRAITSEVNGTKYYDVVNTVREVGHISYDTFVHRISGSWLGFLAGVVGYILLMIRYPLLWVSLPMVVLGFFALKGGLRFTVFAVPFISLGIAYIGWWIASFVKRIFIDEKIQTIARYTIAASIMAAAIYPNYRHIHRYIMPTTFNKAEVEVLDKLRKIAKPQDFVMTWWDYGYPIRYYAGLKTFVDGGKHGGEVNYPVSFALTRPFRPSYNMSILDAAYTDLCDSNSSCSFDILKWIKERYHLPSLESVEPFLYKKIDLPKIKEDIYYFLPLRMLDIFPTVAVFSQIDPRDGKVKNRGFFYQSAGIQKRGNMLLSRGIQIDLQKAVVILGQRAIPIKRFAYVTLLSNGQIKKQLQQVRTEGLNVIVMQSYGKILLMDDFYFASSFIQMFVLDNYDKELFEKVIDSPFAKVFKVKK